MKKEILLSGVASAKENMTIDHILLQSLAEDPRCILHFYRWQRKSVTYGYFIDPWKYLNMPRVDQSLDISQRSTGGGIIFHTCDVAFAALIPAHHPDFSTNTLDNYKLVNAMVVEAVQHFLGNKEKLSLLQEEPVPLDSSCSHFCMAKPTKYDVLIGGRKVGGGAQRRTKYGLLHHGTIALGVPSQVFLNEVLLPNTCVIEAMQKNSYALLGNTWSETEFHDAKCLLQHLLIHAFKKLA